MTTLEQTLKNSQNCYNKIHYCPMKNVLYDVKSLFTNVPIQETIDYILDEIYVKNKLLKACSKLIFKRWLLKLRTEKTFMFTSNFF